MCGIVGVVSHSPVNQLIYDALLLLQHRGHRFDVGRSRPGSIVWIAARRSDRAGCGDAGRDDRAAAAGFLAACATESVRGIRSACGQALFARQYRKVCQVLT